MTKHTKQGLAVFVIVIVGISLSRVMFPSLGQTSGDFLLLCGFWGLTAGFSVFVVLDRRFK